MARTKVRLGLRATRKAIGTALKKAQRAVALGKKRVAKAKRAADHKAVKRNQKALANAQYVAKTLPIAMRALTESCCDQTFDCDPTFD